MSHRRHEPSIREVMPATLKVKVPVLSVPMTEISLRAMDVELPRHFGEYAEMLAGLSCGETPCSVSVPMDAMHESLGILGASPPRSVVVDLHTGRLAAPASQMCDVQLGVRSKDGILYHAGTHRWNAGQGREVAEVWLYSQKLLHIIAFVGAGNWHVFVEADSYPARTRELRKLLRTGVVILNMLDSNDLTPVEKMPHDWIR